jgi:hypothetical protein
MDIPTREELHAEVDARFRSEFPDAPARLSRDAATSRRCDRWLAICDEVLMAQANRVYWEMCPDAALKIPPIRITTGTSSPGSRSRTRA